MKVCELSDESSDVVRRNAMSCDVLRCRRCGTEDRKDVGRDWRADETWGDKIYSRSYWFNVVVQERERSVY